MGALTLPTSGLVYVDTMTVIYTVERMLPYAPLLQPLWLAAQARNVEVVSKRTNANGDAYRPAEVCRHRLGDCV
jgi:hypothetical protein